MEHVSQHRSGVAWGTLLCNPFFIFLVALGVRLAYLYHFFQIYKLQLLHGNLQFGAEMGAVAASIAAGHGFSNPLASVRTGPTAWFVPAYPYLLAAVFRIWGIYSVGSSVAIRVLNAIFSAATCIPVQAIGRRAFGRRQGAGGAWLWAILPSAVTYPATLVWDTSLAALWMALLVAATIRLHGSRRMGAWLGYGMLWAAGALINPSLLAVLPFLAIWTIWPLRGEWGRAIRLGIAASIIFVAGIAPWTIRNYLVFHAFVPLRSNFPLELWMGNNPDVVDDCSCSPHPSANIEEGLKLAHMTEIPYMRQKQREALAFMRAHPGDASRFAFHRFENTWLDLWDPPIDVWKAASGAVRAAIAGNAAFSLLAFCGVLFAYRGQNENAAVFASVLLFFPLVFYVTHPSQRYRHPIEPVMAVLAVYAIACPLAWLEGKILPAIDRRVPMATD